MTIMIPLSRLQIAETCKYCKRLYATHTLIGQLFIGDDPIQYVRCNPPARSLAYPIVMISREAIE